MSFVKIRTAIIIVGMIVLPVLAVVGFKMPGAAGPTRESVAQLPPRIAPTPSAAEPSVAVAKATDAAHSTTAQPSAPAISAHRATNTAPDPQIVLAGGAAVGFPASSVQQASSFDVPPSYPVVQNGAAEDSGIRPTNADAATLSLDSGARENFPTGSVDRTSTNLDPRATPGSQVEPFVQIQDRLKSLGATYYALETWGGDGNLFRFQCRISTGSNTAYTRQFEATDVTAVGAMRAVLDDVEAWREGRLP